MSLVPMVIKRTTDGERSMDLFSRLLDDRIIMLTDEFEDGMASIIVAQLLYLNSVNSTSPITMYINSPGGAVHSMWSIVDTMNHIKAPVHTVCIGMAASCGSVTLVAGEKGHRYILPHAQVMIHQVTGGTKGQVTDMEISLKKSLQTKKILTKFIAEKSGQTYEKVMLDMERDYWLTAQEALEYGLVDVILNKDEPLSGLKVTDVLPLKPKNSSKK